MPVFLFRRAEIGHRVDEIEREGYVITSVIPDDDDDQLLVFAKLVRTATIETRDA